MTFEVGKTYKMRNGLTAKIEAIIAETGEIIGWCRYNENGPAVPLAWPPSGGYGTGFDLIETPRVFYVNVGITDPTNLGGLRTEPAGSRHKGITEIRLVEDLGYSQHPDNPRK